MSSSAGDVLRAWINTGQRAFEYPIPGLLGWYEFPVEIETVRFATDDFISPDDDSLYPNTVWEGRIMDDGVEIVSELKFWVDGDGRATQGSAVSVQIANGDGELDWLTAVDPRDLPVSLRTTLQGEALEDALNVADMVVNDIQIVDSGALRMTFSSSMALYDQPLQSLIFSPSEDPVVAGKVWPISLGAARQTTPTLIDPVNRVYAVHDRGVVGWGYIRDKGAPLDPGAGPPGYVIGADFRTIILETEPEGKLTADISSTGGGTLPVLADDVWLEYGDPFAVALASFDDTVGAAYQATGKLVLTSASLSGIAYCALSTATCLAGRSYRYRVVINSKPGAHSFGMPAVTISTELDNPIVVWTVAGTYEGVFTAPYDFVPRISLAGALTSTAAVISQAYILEIPDTYTPADINAITLTEFFQEIIAERFGKPADWWSMADTVAIDTETGYTGIGFNVTEPITVRDALDSALSAYTASAWIDDDNTLRVTRLTDPADETPVGEITEDDLLHDLSVKPDLAPGLSNQMRYRRNWTAMSETDFVTDFVVVPLATRVALGQAYQGIVASAIQLGPTYRHAIYSDPKGVLLDAEVDAQAEIDRIVSYYSVPRFFYTTEISAEFDVQLGQVWTLTHPRYGLDVGKPLMICKLSKRPIAGTIAITLRG